jgi:hypothetical protein
LSARVAAALKEKASDLFSQAPVIEKVDILAAKLPQQIAGNSHDHIWMLEM